jgi:hypothetical protein
VHMPLVRIHNWKEVKLYLGMKEESTCTIAQQKSCANNRLLDSREACPEVHRLKM